MTYAIIEVCEKAHCGDVPEYPGAGADRRGKDDGRSAKAKAKGQKPKRRTVGAGEAPDRRGIPPLRSE